MRKGRSSCESHRPFDAHALPLDVRAPITGLGEAGRREPDRYRELAAAVGADALDEPDESLRPRYSLTSGHVPAITSTFGAMRVVWSTSPTPASAHEVIVSEPTVY